MNIYEEVDDLQQRAKDRMEGYLHAQGWHHTSNNPIHYWLWKKEIDGTTFMVDTVRAWQIQCALDRADG